MSKVHKRFVRVVKSSNRYVGFEEELRTKDGRKWIEQKFFQTDTPKGEKTSGNMKLLWCVDGILNFNFKQ